MLHVFQFVILKLKLLSNRVTMAENRFLIGNTLNCKPHFDLLSTMRHCGDAAILTQSLCLKQAGGRQHRRWLPCPAL